MRAVDDTYFTTSDRPVKVRLCDHPSCGEKGDYRAPKSRDQLNQYYFFCLDHVRDYNKAWDYFSGLSPEEVEHYTRDATVWERPSWPLGSWNGQGGAAERALRDKAMRHIFGDAYADAQETPASPPPPLAEREALATLEMTAPATFAAIKSQYRALVKKHHPDLNHGDAEAMRENEEKFKSINQAFAILRKIYEAGDSV